MHGHDFNKMDIPAKEQYTKDTILYLLEETHELLREINFKTYKKVRKPVNQQNIEEELSDIYLFFMNLCLVWDVSIDDLLEAVSKKQQINTERIQNKDY
jgi:NTP pyrophosphatase (non-canonical NTP hydrolase)